MIASVFAMETTLLLGERSAPESAIMVPANWEGGFEPSAVLALDIGGRVGLAQGFWGQAHGNGWGYFPDVDASEVQGEGGGGWQGEQFEVAGRYTLAWFPLLSDTNNGRAELLMRSHHAVSDWSFNPLLTGVDRRFFRSPAASFSTVELGMIAKNTTMSAMHLDIGLSGQGNKAGAEGGPWGFQARSLLGFHFFLKNIRFSTEYRFYWAMEGEAEVEAPAVFTLWGDYDDDVDALSGGGFMQHWSRVSGAMDLGKWTLAAGGLVRLRSVTEGNVQFGQSFGGQLRVDRQLNKTWVWFVSTGVNTASSSINRGYIDIWGWSGVAWQY